jgi:membrane protease YdiL (CAAX protease family)
MTIPLQLVVFSIPALIYVIIHRWRGGKWGEPFGNVGWKTCRPIHFLLSLGVAILTGGLAGLAFRFIPSDVLQSPNINISDYAGWTQSVTSFLLAWVREAVYVALGEEILFRGLLGGWLVRRFGFAVGNTVQALIFLLPHLLLLLVSLSLWPIILVQLLAGWLLGWLRCHSDSILPGWLAHSLINALGALVAMA